MKIDRNYPEYKEIGSTNRYPLGKEKHIKYVLGAQWYPVHLYCCFQYMHGRDQPLSTGPSVCV